MVTGGGLNHDHGYNRSRSHSHQHHQKVEVGTKLVVALFVTATVFFAELLGGYWTHSLALLSDAWHVLADAAALGLAWLAYHQAKKESSLEKTFGYHRFEVITAFINGLSLLFISAYIMFEAVERMLNPQVVKSKEMFIIASIGLIANGFIAVLLNSSAKNNLNIRSAFLHVLGDALASFGVIIGGLVMLKYQWYIIDPIISILISAMIVKGALQVTKKAFHILMEGAPDNLNLPEIMEAVKKLDGVTNVHDLHAWSLSGKINYLTMHVLISTGDSETILQEINKLLRDEFDIQYSTVQVEQKCHGQGTLVSDLEEVRASRTG